MSEPEQQFGDLKIINLEILEEDSTPVVKDDISAQQTIKMEDTLNTSETDNFESMLKDSEPSNETDLLDIKSEQAVTDSTPDGDSYSKIEIVNVHSIYQVKNDICTEQTINKRADTPLESSSEKIDNSQQILTDTNNPSEKNEESQSNVNINNQDNQYIMSIDDNNDKESVTISVSPTVDVVLPPSPDDCGNKNNDNVIETQSDRVNIESQVEETKKEDIENMSGEIDDLLPSNPEDGSNKNNDSVSETQSGKDSIEIQEEMKKDDIENISGKIDDILPPNLGDGGNKNNDSVGETQSVEDSIEIQEEEEMKKEDIENISGKIDDSKLESTNTPEQPQESNSNILLNKDINDSQGDIEMESSATQCNGDNHNMSIEDNGKESATNATLSVTPTIGILPPNSDHYSNNSINQTQSDKGVVETQEIVSKPSSDGSHDNMYLQFKSEIDALDSSEHESTNTANTSQNTNSCKNDNSVKTACEPKEVMGPPTYYKWEFGRRDKFMIPHVLKLLGFQLELKFSNARNIIKDKVKHANLPPLTFRPEDKKKVLECRAIFTSNWPTWIAPQTIKLVLVLLTDLNFNKTVCCIETLTYRDKKEMGAALISFTSADICFHVFNQLRNICLLNNNVKVELDLDNKIRQTFTGVFIPSGVEDSYTTTTITEDKWLTKSEEISINSEKLLRRVTVTSKEAPPNYRPDTKPHFGAPKMDPTDDQQKVELGVIHGILGLKVLPFSPYHETKRVFQKKLVTILRTMPQPPFSHTCTCIYIANVPSWFEYIHFLYVLEIATTIKWHPLYYFIEILQYSNGVNRGAALLRLRNPKLCRKVFSELRGLLLLKRNKKKDNIFVTMDLYSKFQNQITKPPPQNWKSSVSAKSRSRYVRTNVDMPPNHVLKPRPVAYQNKFDQLENSQSNSAADTVPDHTKSQDHADIKTEIPENIDLTEIIDENLMDIDFDEMAEDCAPNSNDNSVTDASSTQNNTEKPVRSSFVHVKLLPPGYKSHCFYQILSETANFRLRTKYYGIRFLRDEDKRILNECLLKFDSPDDANVVTERLDGFAIKNIRVEAKLLQESDLPSWGNDSFEVSNPLKRKLDSGDDDHHESSTSKKNKFDEDWQIGYYERAHMLVPDSTEEKFGVNPIMLKKLNVKRFISPNIIVKNLHKDVSENKLREVFSLAGRVVDITKRFRAPSYKAKIEYEHPLEALQAISMFNGQTLYGCEMAVSVFTEAKPKFLPMGLGGIGKGFGPKGAPLKCVHSHLEVREIYDILCRMGQVHLNMNKEHPFAGEYTPSVTYPNKKNPFDLTTTKPNAETAIEALGKVLIALDIIPSGTDTKDLRSIVNALQKHPKVAQVDKKHNIQQPQTIINQDRNNKIEAFYKNYSGLMQQMEQQFPGWNGHSQAAPTNTGQNIYGPNLNNTGPRNVQPQTFPVEPHIRPEHSNRQLHNMPILGQPNKEFGPPGFWSTNANAQSEPMQCFPAVTPHINPNMQSFPAVTPHINPNMQSLSAAPPNINPNMENFTLGIPNIAPGYWNINANAQNEPYRMPNMQTFPAVTPNINSYTMQNFPAGPSHINPNVRSAPEGIINMTTNMQMTHSSMPNIATNEQNYPTPGVDITMNPQVPTPENTKMKHTPPDKNGNPHEAPAPPRWGDPRIQEILAGKNMPRKHPTDARVKAHTSNKTPSNQKSHSKLIKALRSDSSRTHYDPRSDSKKDGNMSSGDDFESDLLQFKNLPSSVTAKALGRKIKEVGEIIFAEMTGKGKALVRFKRVKDAERCIRLFHQSKVDGHVIDVTPV